MKLSEVTNQDGKMCAQLINLLRGGRWELSGSDIQAYQDTCKWAAGLAALMAAELRQDKPDTSIRVKQVGSLPGKASLKGKKKK